MRTISTVFRIVFRRSVANWRLLATVIVGVVLSAGLMSTVSLYSDTVRDLGLQHNLEQEDPFALDVRVLSSSQRLNRTEFERVDEAVRFHTAPIESLFLGGSARFLRSATFFPTAPGGDVDEADDLRPRAHFQAADALADHVSLIEGSFPARAVAPANPANPPTLEVIISSVVAERDNLGVGTLLDLHPFWDLSAEPVVVTIVGIFEPNDATERYWARNPERYEGGTTSWPTYPLFVSGEPDLIDVVAAYLPTIDGLLEWYGLVDIERITSRNADEVSARVKGLEGGLAASVPRTSVTTELDETVELFREKLFFTRLPLFALMLQVVGIVLYYLIMVATMLQERQVGEIALLRSRGASVAQVVGMTALEGGVICGAAVIFGPLLASGAISVLGLTPQFEDLSGGDLLEVPITRGAFLMATLGAGLAYLALLWPAYQAARKTMVDYKTTLARPDQQPIFIRYYLDLVLIAAAAFAFYQLRQRGSLVTERLFGDLSADPLLLISPTLFMLMVALVFIRLFPLGLRAVAWSVAGLRGPTVALGMWRMVRSPMHYSRLILLLLLATAVGMFAAGFRATMEQGYDDRSAYEAVAEARIADIRTPIGLTLDAFPSAIESRTRAETASPVVRVDGTYNRTVFQTIDIDVVGVDPAEVAPMVFWRDDFAGSSRADLLGRVIDTLAFWRDATPRTAEEMLSLVRQDAGFEPVRGLSIPGGSTVIAAWIQLPLQQNTLQPWVRLRDSRGVYWEYRLFGPAAAAAPGEWRLFMADLQRPPGRRQVSGPLGATLDAVFLRPAGPPPPFPETVTVLIDDIQVTDRETDLVEAIRAQQLEGARVIEAFEEPGPYELITGASSIGEPGAISRAEVFDREGRYAQRISFTRQQGTPPVIGLRVAEGPGLVPVIVDKGFLEAADVRDGDEISVYYNRQYVRVHIVGVFNYFPGYDPESVTHLMVGDIATITRVGSRVPFVADEIGPTEAWLSGLTEPLDRDTLSSRGLTANIISERAALRAEASADPLVAASWEGILFLSFAAVLGLTALGFAVYAVLAARARSLEFAILRTMGYTSRQILALVSFEQLFVIGAGIVVGTLLGFPLGRLMISYLGVTESGGDPLPPLVAEVSWVTVLTVYGLLAGVFVATVGALARVYSKIAVARALRIGEI